MIESPLLFAHVRAATLGLLTSEANCHPFRYGQVRKNKREGFEKFSEGEGRKEKQVRKPIVRKGREKRREEKSQSRKGQGRGQTRGTGKKKRRTKLFPLILLSVFMDAQRIVVRF